MSVTLTTSALTDRVDAWLSTAMTRAKITPSPESDGFFATLPPFRRFLASALTESGSLASLRVVVSEWAWGEIALGHELPSWESSTPPEVTPEVRRLVRVSNLKTLLHQRAAAWGCQRQNLPPHAIERVLSEIDALVSRHASRFASSGN